MTKPVIEVIGWYDRENIGDESYKLSFPIVFPDYDLRFSDMPTPEAQTVILGGGDVVCEGFLKNLKHVPTKFIYSASVSKPEHIEDFIFVGVRDLDSIANCNKVGVVPQYVPDFAFALSGNAEMGKELLKEHFKGFDLYEKVVAVVLNRNMLPEYQGVGSHQQNLDFEYLAHHLSYAIDQTCASFIFLPFGTMPPWDDRVTNSWVYSKCKFWKKNVCVYSPLGVQNTIDIISACDGVISTRLHSSIFACVGHTPFIDITHNHKNKRLLETIGLQHLSLPIDSLSYSALFQRINDILTNGVDVKEGLLAVDRKQKCILREFAKNVRLG